MQAVKNQPPILGGTYGLRVPVQTSQRRVVVVAGKGISWNGGGAVWV